MTRKTKEAYSRLYGNNGLLQNAIRTMFNNKRIFKPAEFKFDNEISAYLAYNESGGNSKIDSFHFN